jgi:hypothetical protein
MIPLLFTGPCVALNTLCSITLLVANRKRLSPGFIWAKQLWLHDIITDLEIQVIVTGVHVALENTAALGADEILAGRSLTVQRHGTLVAKLGNVGNGIVLFVTLTAASSRSAR